MKLDTVFGQHAVQILFKTGIDRVETLWVQRGRDDHKTQKLIQQAKKNQIPVLLKTRKELDAETNDGNHQGVLATAKPGKHYSENSLYDLVDAIEKDPFLLVLDGVTDPHNLGACLRSAEAAGVHAVIVPKDNSASVNETVRKVACGAADVIPLIPVTNLVRCIEKLKDKGIWFVGTSGEADKSVYETKLTGPLAIVMGAEGDGMRRLTKEACDFMAFLPMAGEVSSLNVSVATGVCLFEAVRQKSIR